MIPWDERIWQKLLCSLKQRLKECMEVSEFCGSSFCYLQDTSSCSSMVKHDGNAAVSRNRCGHLVRTAKDCHSFIEEFATSEQLTRQQHGNNSFQWFSKHQPTKVKKSVPCCRRSKHQTTLARESMLASQDILRKTFSNAASPAGWSWTTALCAWGALGTTGSTMGW